MIKTTEMMKKTLLRNGLPTKRIPSLLSNNLTQMKNLKMKHNMKFSLEIAAKEILFSYASTIWLIIRSTTLLSSC